MNQDVSSCVARSNCAKEQARLGSVWPWVFVVFSAVNAACVTLAISGEWSRLHFPCVLGASSGFVLAAVSSGALHSVYGRFILAGLIACWCGDVLGAEYFLTGLVSFCVAHMAFICAFIAKGVDWRRLAAALLPMLIVVVTIVKWLLPHVEAPIEIVAVCAYCTAISLMALTAIGASKGPVGRLILAGAVTIYISDIFLARWKYVDFGTINGRFCYPLYYTAS